MARETKYWLNTMVTEKNAIPNLAPLTSNSEGSGWGFLYKPIAACAAALDNFFDLFKTDAEALAKKAKVGQTPWYAIVAKLFQNGDSLAWNGEEWAYPVPDVTKQIVTRASAKEIPNYVILKVAKDVGGVNTKLSVAELANFTLYMNKVKCAGILLNIISDDPDDVKLFVTCNYDPMVLSATGELITTPGVFPAEDAINKYLKTLNDDVDFKGLLELQTVIDYLQDAEPKGCITSSYITSAEARFGANPFVAFPERYEANAGHVKIDAGTPLNGSITYVPSV